MGAPTPEAPAAPAAALWLSDPALSTARTSGARPRAARRSSGVREAFEGCEVKLRVAMALQAALLVWDL